MSTKRKFKSDAFESIHVSASGLLKVGAIDKATMMVLPKAWCATSICQAGSLVKFDRYI